MVPLSFVDRRDTHRLIPAQFADGGASVLTRLSEDDTDFHGIFELDNATNDRLLAESGKLSGLDARELVFGIASYRIINAAFCHPSNTGGRFNSSSRGAWYCGFATETSQAEVAYHKQRWLQETQWDEDEPADYVDYLADFRTDFHDLRNIPQDDSRLSPSSYNASQLFAEQLLEAGAAGLIYPSVRRRKGICICCFRPVLVTHVRRAGTYSFLFSQSITNPSYRITRYIS